MATGALDPNGIWQYGEDDSEPTFSGLLNKLGSSTSTTVTRLETMAGLTPAQAVTARQNLGTGLTKIIPSSVTYVGGTGSTVNGVANAVACSGVTLNGVFTSQFDNYRIVVVGISSATNSLIMRLASGGVNDGVSTWSYGSYTCNATALSFNGGSVSTTTPILTTWTVEPSLTIYDVLAPAKAEKKRFVSSGGTASTGMWSFGTGGGTAAKDGLHVFLASANLTGSITVYGYNQ